MSKGFYFGAGPAMLPEPILKQAQHDILEWQNSGLSILELGHRTEAFRDLLDSAEASLRRLLKVPDNYHILFLTGPARMLFGMIPLNFLAEGQTAGYLVTGIWSKMAYEEAQKLKSVECMASSEAAQFLKIPESHARQINPDWAYCYYTPNETVNGIYCPRPSLPQQIRANHTSRVFGNHHGFENTYSTSFFICDACDIQLLSGRSNVCVDRGTRWC